MTAQIARTFRLTTIALALAFTADVNASRAEAQAWYPALHPSPGSELTLDLDGSSFTIPVVGGSAKLTAALGAR